MKLDAFNYYNKGEIEINDNATDDQIMDKVYDELKYQSWIAFRLS